MHIWFMFHAKIFPVKQIKFHSSVWHSYVRASKIYFQITTNKMKRSFIYLFLQILYMFQAVSPPIIRSTKLYIQLQILSTNTVASWWRGWDGTFIYLYVSGVNCISLHALLYHIAAFVLYSLFLMFPYWYVSLPVWHSISSTLPASSSIGWQYLKLCIPLCAPDDGRRNRLKHVQHL